MTSSRVVRGTKGRILLCICAILIITGIIACYNNTLSQLDDVRRSNDQCHQQQENLSTQLQVIYDYKQRLEKSLKTEKAEHQQSKKDLENRVEEEKSKHEKATNEANLKFSSLQQHYNLLQTQHEDFKEECSKTQQQQLDEINDLQSKLKEVQGQMKQALSEKDNTLEHLKTQYLQLQVEKDNLQKQIKGTESSHFQFESEINHLMKANHELQKELDKWKAKCSSMMPKEETLNEPFHSKQSGNSSKQIDNPEKQEAGNVADLPSNAHQNVVEIPRSANEEQLEIHNEGLDNEHVLVAPNQMQDQNQKSSSTTKTNSDNKSVFKASLDAAQPLRLPTVSPSSNKIKPSQESRALKADHNVLPLPYSLKKLPMDVVPAPNPALEAVAEDSKRDARRSDLEDRDIREDVRNAFPNRYRANLVLNELANENKAKEDEKRINEASKQGNQHNQQMLKSDVGDKENNALENLDSPLNEKDGGLNDNPFGLDDVQNIVDKPNDKVPHKLHKQHINLVGGEAAKLNDGQRHQVYDAHDGADYKDVQLEDADPEEDDDPEYADAGHPKDPAVRN